MIGNIKKQGLVLLLKWMTQQLPPETLRPVWAELLEGLQARCYANPSLATPEEGDQLYIEPVVYADAEQNFQASVRLMINTECITLPAAQARLLAGEISYYAAVANFAKDATGPIMEVLPNNTTDMENTWRRFFDWLGEDESARSLDAVIMAMDLPEDANDRAQRNLAAGLLYRHGLRCITEATRVTTLANFREFLKQLFTSARSESIYASIVSTTNLRSGDSSEGLSRQDREVVAAILPEDS